MANEERALIRIRIAILFTVAYLYRHREESRPPRAEPDAP